MLNKRKGIRLIRKQASNPFNRSHQKIIEIETGNEFKEDVPNTTIFHSRFQEEKKQSQDLSKMKIKEISWPRMKNPYPYLKRYRSTAWDRVHIDGFLRNLYNIQWFMLKYSRWDVVKWLTQIYIQSNDFKLLKNQIKKPQSKLRPPLDEEKKKLKKLKLTSLNFLILLSLTECPCAPQIKFIRQYS